MVDFIIEVVIWGTGHLILRLFGRDREKPKQKRRDLLNEAVFFELEFWVGLCFWGTIFAAIFLFSRYR